MQKSWMMLIGLGAAVLLTAQPAAAGVAGMCSVMITNITPDQPLSPAVVATSFYKKDVDMFDLGMPADEALRILAENGNPMALAGQLNNKGAVAVTTSGPIPPFETAEILVPCKRFISVATMLVNTDDGFAAINGELTREMEFYPPAYDAGTEVNTESCQDIPGPACPGSPNGRTPEGGSVHIHKGILGTGDVSPILTWNNPVAIIKVKRAH